MLRRAFRQEARVQCDDELGADGHALQGGLHEPLEEGLEERLVGAFRALEEELVALAENAVAEEPLHHPQVVVVRAADVREEGRILERNADGSFQEFPFGIPLYRYTGKKSTCRAGQKL